MVSFLHIVVKLYNYKDSDVGNLRKLEYFYDSFRHSRIVWKYNLTSNLRLCRPVLKVKNISNCKAIFEVKQMGLFLIYQGMWGLRDRIV